MDQGATRCQEAFSGMGAVSLVASPLATSSIQVVCSLTYDAKIFDPSGEKKALSCAVPA
jgi:hypothetical protein